MPSPCVILEPDELRIWTDIGKEHAIAGAVSFEDWSVAMVQRHGTDVRPFLMQIYNNLRRRKFPGVERMTRREELAQVSRNLEFVQVLGDDITPEMAQAAKESLRSMGFGEDIVDPTKMEKFVEWATAIKLTGMSTHFRNIGGNTSMLLMRAPVKLASASFDFARGAFLGLDRTVRAREALADFYGTFAGMGRALNRFMEVLDDPAKALGEITKTEEFTRGIGKIGKGGRIGDNIDRMFKAATNEHLGFDFGEVVRFPFRILSATDVFFKELNISAEVYSQVTRAALNRGLSGVDLAKQINRVSKEVFTNPDDFRGLLEVANRSALRNTFQEPLAGATKELNQWINRHPLAKLFVPFFKTPVNLLKTALRHTPGAGFLVKSDWNKFGTFGKINKANRIGLDSEQFITMLGQQFVGGAFLYWMFSEAAAGNISAAGGKSVSRERTLRATGWKPFSFRVQLPGVEDDIWVSYRGFEPMSSWLRTAGDTGKWLRGDTEKLEELGTTLLDSYMKQFAENPFLLGISDFMKALSGKELDPTTRVANFLSNMAIGSTVPVIMQQWGRIILDPTIRRGETFTEKFLARTPGASLTQKPARDIWGEPITREGRGIFQAMGFDIAVQDNSKLSNVIRDLKNSQGKSLSIGLPSRKIGGTELSADEYDRLLAISGARLKESLTKFVNSEAFENLNDDRKFATMSKIVSNERDTVRRQEFKKYYVLKGRSRSRRRRSRSRKR